MLSQTEEVHHMVAQEKGVAWAGSLDQARERAKKEGKPVLIDFSAAPM